MMQYVLNGDIIPFSKFQDIFPAEAEILENHQHNSWKIIIENGQMKYKEESFNPIFIDIAKELERHKIYFYKNSPYKENLAKALGLKAGVKRPSVLDATGGMLSDSCMIKALGVDELIVLERHPIVGALIQNAMPSNFGIEFKFQSGLDFTEEIDVVFFDPMYTEKNMKASPKKEMQIFRTLVGPDEDAKDIAKHLLSIAQRRLVIKRSSKASPLLEKPQISFRGKSTSYDVYLKKK